MSNRTISKVKMGDTSYDVKDTTARENATNFATQEDVEDLYENSEKFISFTNLRTFYQNMLNVFSAIINDLKNDIFVKKTDKSVANGVASLDSNAEVPSTELNLAVNSDITGLYPATGATKFITLSNLPTVATKLIEHVNSWGTELRTLINNITMKIDSSTPSTLKTINSNYNDSSNKLATQSDLFSGSYNDLTNKPTLFSGSYDDLTNKPIIPKFMKVVSTSELTIICESSSSSTKPYLTNNCYGYMEMSISSVSNTTVTWNTHITLLYAANPSFTDLRTLFNYASTSSLATNGSYTSVVNDDGENDISFGNVEYSDVKLPSDTFIRLVYRGNRIGDTSETANDIVVDIYCQIQLPDNIKIEENEELKITISI